jgi:glycosyltransferase involved in cell wall biosynthesis
MRNLALAANLKIELVAELLRQKAHDVEIVSQGEVVEYQGGYFPPFSESLAADSSIPVFYASALPIRFVNGRWSANRTVRLLRARHEARNFDLALIYNLKQPQVACALHAASRLHLPVVVEYEDDSFVDVRGSVNARWFDGLELGRAQQVIDSASACAGVSPHLLSRFPRDIPRLLLRGVISPEIMQIAGRGAAPARLNRIVYSGTFTSSKGLLQLIAAWKVATPPDWELHLAGDGVLGEEVRRCAAGCRGVVFHGLLDRKQNAALLATARIGINPHDLSATPGNVFAFKIIEYLAAGLHVLSTPMGPLEPELERGITYLPDNRPETIAAVLSELLRSRAFEGTATDAAIESYGPAAVANSLDELLRGATRNATRANVYSLGASPRASAWTVARHDSDSP